ncbi:hypothetical protein GCM10010178_91260 [Lentzea flava]|uniref:Uncharacterized protein n=1 Tax=Lentzea flava TaxID=103732 RepID=A0ABQ2VHV3_9PSEU|nr:hypothetical protein GCM10010178_91260 [Lentzea flava]
MPHRNCVHNEYRATTAATLGVSRSARSLGLVGLLVALIGSYVLRVAPTVMPVAGAPLALGCHGLEQTEGIAWSWRAFFGVGGIQVG